MPLPHSSTFALVLQAMREKRAVHAVYKGRSRRLYPHVLGHSAHGEEQALFYQSGGGSVSGLDKPGSADNWRCMPLRELDSITLGPPGWRSARNYDAATQSCIAQVTFAVVFP